jgi:glycosyltransferase involved in cell wall biosynthesis
MGIFKKTSAKKLLFGMNLSNSNLNGSFNMSLDEVLPTVIIPAYNEKKVIAKLLTALHCGVVNKSFQVIVACNSTNDGSVEFISEHFPLVTCLDIKQASKTNALNEAEKLNLGFPRIFIDADITISAEAVKILIHYTSQFQDAALVAPRGKINTDSSDFLVRIFYSGWMKTPFYLEHGFGSGIYVLNKKARANFEFFPDIIADDGFIREVVMHEQLHICEVAESTVEAPRNIKDLLNIKIRSKLGNQQLANLGLIRNTNKVTKRFLHKLTLLETLVYFTVNYIANRGAAKKLKTIEQYTWQRDESSRL